MNTTTKVALDEPALDLAAREYLARRMRNVNPEGEFDAGGRWEPSDQERQYCCAFIRNPSRAWPYSLMVHCRSAEHVAALHDVEPIDLKRAARRIQTESERERGNQLAQRAAEETL